MSIREPEKKSFFKKLVSGLTKTRDKLVTSLESTFMAYSVIDDDFYDELEEILIMSDLGVQTAEEVIEDLKERVKEKYIGTPDRCEDLLIDILKDKMAVPDEAYDFEDETSVIFIIGVNGVGKTTSIGKLAYNYRNEGRKVLIAACDTFRAAAIEQLNEWALRSQCPMISQSEGSDPSAVLFDAVNAAKSRNTDMLFVDTAGRLHNKKNLMKELEKMSRVIDNGLPGIHRENLLVLDATTGQNAVEQAREFKDVCQLTGIILTKMDGTAKGGIAIAIQNELGIPVKFIGVGESIDDLQKFDADDFVDALFDR